MATDVSFSQAQAASFGVGLVRLGLGLKKRGAGDDGGRGVGRTDVAWEREEANTRALVTNDPRGPARYTPGRRIMMTSAMDWVSRP